MKIDMQNNDSSHWRLVATLRVLVVVEDEQFGVEPRTAAGTG